LSVCSTQGVSGHTDKFGFSNGSPSLSQITRYSYSRAVSATLSTIPCHRRKSCMVIDQSSFRQWVEKEQCQPSPLSNIHQSDRQRKFLDHVRGCFLNCLSTDHRVATCCHRTRCWCCLNEGHRSFSCPGRIPHHHNRIEEDHDLCRRGPMDDFYNSMGHHRGRVKGPNMARGG
jgi:hypothetical protein